MYDNSIDSIKNAQSGDKFELEKLINDNNRAYLEYCEKIYWKRLRIRRFISNWLYWLYKVNTKV